MVKYLKNLLTKMYKSITMEHERELVTTANEELARLIKEYEERKEVYEKVNEAQQEAEYINIPLGMEAQYIGTNMEGIKLYTIINLETELPMPYLIGSNNKEYPLSLIPYGLPN